MRKKSRKRKGIYGLHVFQHLWILAAAAALLLLFTGSSVLLKGVEGNYSYRIPVREQETAQEPEYEDSSLFSFILSQGVKDVARMAAVRSQMETNGKFDGRKEIDVAFFFYRFKGIPDQYVTARYYLEDLIHWGEEGVEYEERLFSRKEAALFLNDSSAHFWIDDRLPYSGIVTPFNADLEDWIYHADLPAEELLERRYTRGEQVVEVLQNRYPSVEGMQIEDYTAVWEDYEELAKYVAQAAEDLARNYQEYQRYGAFYELEHTNLRYYMIKRIGDRQEIYTNLSWRGSSEEEITGQFQQYGKFLYFQPSEMKYETNTGVSEDTVRHLFNAFEYAYPENMSVWIGVDTSYPVRDVFVQGKEGYDSRITGGVLLILFAAACLLLYLGNMIFLTVKEGWEEAKEEEGKVFLHLQSIDRIPTELMIPGTILVLGGILAVLIVLFDSGAKEFYYTDWFLAVGTGTVVICEILFSTLYYSLVRRLKGDNFWKDSITGRIWKKLG